jgi:predicted ATPase
MSELAADFSSLPAEYQDVLRLAQDTHKIEVTPLQELKGGRTGARLYLVSVSSPDSDPVQRPVGHLRHFVLKLDRKSKKTKMDELKRHSTALSQAPSGFARNHIANLAFDRVELEGAVAIFYSIAGQSLHHYRPLASYQRQSRLEMIFRATNEVLLAGWNAALTFEQAVHPQKLLAQWLGYRLQPGGNIEHFLEDACHIPQDTAGLLIQGQVFPNPLVYARESERWGAIRPIDAMVGFQHGDLNIGNILAKFNGNGGELAGYYLIDFALFKAQMPLLYDQRYLEMSYLIRELTRAPFPKWVDLVTRFAEGDIVDPHQVPIELAGACAVIGAGRRAFGDWVQASYPSLSDDLWGQFWLAAVAVGLNYCNKAIIPEQEQLAGLIFAAAHLKRYHATFGASLPVEIKHLDIAPGGAGRQPSQSLRADTVTRSPNGRPDHNLPAQPTPFIGRQAEVTVVKELLMRDPQDVRLVTLTGPGGTGKTRLALRTATDLVDHFEDGVYFVDLAPIREPESVLAAIAQTIGLRETSDRPLLDKLKGGLRARMMLLLLDNFEQVTAAAPQMGELLRDCPQLKLLVTSREALRLRGEHVFPVPPLAVPQADLKRPSIEQLTRYEAIQLFIERAQAVKHDFDLTNENAPAVAEICLRLDGLPLAIELAAARISLFSPQALLERVGSRLKLLRGGARDLPVRQQTLRDTIDWSYELLDTGEQRLFALLSVFSGCTFEAVEGMAGGEIKQLDETGVEVLDGLASLVDKSLIRRADQDAGEPRFLMLETIREYAAERLEEDREFSAAARRAHAIYFADFTQRQWERLTGYQREAALAEIESDIENLRTAWRYWVAEVDFEQLRKLTDCLWLLYDVRGWYDATVDLITDLLNVLASTPSTPERAQQEIMLQTSLARALLSIKGYMPEVEQAYTRALELSQAVGEIPQLFPVLRGLSSFYSYVTDFEKSARMGEQILSLAERQDDASMRAEGHLVLGYNLGFLGRLSLGLDHLEKAIANYDPDQRRSFGFRFGNNPGVTCFTTSALFLWMLGFPDRALKRADDAVALANRLNHPFSMAYALFHTGLLHLWRREAELVQARAQAALEIAEKHEFHIWRAVATCLQGAALAGMDRAEEGLMRIKQGIDRYEELKTPPVFWPMLLLIRAVACGQAGRPEEGLNLLDQAIEIFGQGSEDFLLAELCRLKGDLLLALSPENLAEAEPWFQRALEIAQKREARMLELRAAISLSRLWQGQGKAADGRRLLSDAYGRLTEGFTTVDLKEAKALLEELS